jgi:hypothetical protein
MDKNKKIKFIFYYPEDGDLKFDTPVIGGILNSFKCVNPYINKYKHVDIVNEENVRFGIAYEIGFYTKTKDLFKNCKKDILEICVTTNEYTNIFLNISKHKHKNYDTIGLLLSPIPILSAIYHKLYESDSFFSSEFLLKILIEASVIKGDEYNPSIINPEEFYNILKVDCKAKTI